MFSTCTEIHHVRARLQVDEFQYDVTVENMVEIFRHYGEVVKIAIFQKNNQWQALIQYPDHQARLLERLPGSCILSQCCTHAWWCLRGQVALQNRFWPAIRSKSLVTLACRCLIAANRAQEHETGSLSEQVRRTLAERCAGGSGGEAGAGGARHV